MIARSILCKALYTCVLVLVLGGGVSAQNTPAGNQQPAADAGTSTDLFLMPGSDFDRPGPVPRANLNIGIGHTLGFLKKDPVGDELSAAGHATNTHRLDGLHRGRQVNLVDDDHPWWSGVE